MRNRTVLTVNGMFRLKSVYNVFGVSFGTIAAIVRSAFDQTSNLSIDTKSGMRGAARGGSVFCSSSSSNSSFCLLWRALFARGFRWNPLSLSLPKCTLTMRWCLNVTGAKCAPNKMKGNKIVCHSGILSLEAITLAKIKREHPAVRYTVPRSGTQQGSSRSRAGKWSNRWNSWFFFRKVFLSIQSILYARSQSKPKQKKRTPPIATKRARTVATTICST